MTEQEKREKVINGLVCCREMNNPPGYRMTGCHECPYHDPTHEKNCVIELKNDAITLLKAQEQVINDMFSRYEMLCKEIREKYESDDVCGLCQYDGAYVGDSGDWMNECPGFETNECFCMKNSIRKMCGQPLIEEP